MGKHTNVHAKNKDCKAASAGRGPKLTKQERRAKFTQLARERSQKQRKRQEQRNLVCFHCRQRGHGVGSCPQIADNHETQQEQQQQPSSSLSLTKCCYKCGSTDHGLSSCPKRNKGSNKSNQKYDPDEDLPFATCFVCHAQGHLASQCPNNEKGIYVHGGCCKVCGSKKHLSNACPEKLTNKNKQENDVDDDDDKALPKLLDNLDDLIEEDPFSKSNQKDSRSKGDDLTKTNKSKTVTKKRRVVKF